MTAAKGDNENKFLVIFVLGGPGCGKGTQCSNISSTFDYVHLSAGDLLRVERNKPNSKDGGLIESHMQNGTIVPIEITCRLIEHAMAESGKKKFLIDGFPRNQNNLDGWNQAMSEKVRVQLVIYVECSDDVCVKRCLGRTEGRTDDNEATLKKRLDQFKKECKQIIDYFDKQHLVFKVNGDLNKEEVFNALKTRITALH